MNDITWVAERDGPVPADVARLLLTVPEWFGREESNAEYVEAARTKETWTVRDHSGQVVGVTLIDRHFPHVAEIHLIVTDRALHGSGVGTVNELPDDQVAIALADVRRRLPRNNGRAWSPEFLGIVDGTDLPADLATHTDDYLAVSGFGRNSV